MPSEATGILSLAVRPGSLLDAASARIPAGARVGRYGVASAALWLEYLIVRSRSA
jgi:hypothetical protein